MIASFNVDDAVRPTAGPYEGRAGIIRSRRDNGFFEVELHATDYAARTVGVFDPRYLRRDTTNTK